MVVARGGGEGAFFYRTGRGGRGSALLLLLPSSSCGAAAAKRQRTKRALFLTNTRSEGTPFSLFPSRTLLAIPSLLPLPESLSPLWNGVVCGWRRRRVSQQRPSVAIRSSRGERGMAYFRERERGKKARSLRPSLSPSLLLLTLVSSVSVSVGRRRRWPREKRGASLCRVRSVRLFRVTVPAKVS